MARASADGPDGIVLVDKPAGWTSHDVVSRMRRVLGTRKVGHGGTLDPMATGLLVIAAGRATRLLTYYSGADKDYTATIRLGQSTVTDDAEGEVTASADASGVTDEAIAAAVAGLTGEILQRPSAVSAIKVGGERSYARVRAGEDVELPARPVTVSRFAVLATRREGALVDLDVEVSVSSGTYVRALARDLGQALGVGGHLTALRRTRVGDLSAADAATLDALTAAADAGEEVPLVGLTAAALAVLPPLAVAAADARALGHGQGLPLPAGTDIGAPAHKDDPTHDVVALGPDREAVAILRRRGDRLMPVIVFAPAAAQ
ncbi:MAG: tRNA pseudouridine(55) synthase TruB [Actinomycetes bacterium]|nr:MAG: tRNA pseudouridine(55) synthase TruB [Actinomycetota bacterium]